MAGLDTVLARQLVEVSKEDHIMQNCPRDSEERFTSVESVETWLGKGRLALPLVKKIRGRRADTCGFWLDGAGQTA